MDDRSVGGIDHARLRGPNVRRWTDPVRVSLLDPGPDVKRVYTDANQVCRDKAILRGAKADYANNHAVNN
jgi:hypothetical protein